MVLVSVMLAHLERFDESGTGDSDVPKVNVLKRKAELLGVVYGDSCVPGCFYNLLCPKVLSCSMFMNVCTRDERIFQVVHVLCYDISSVFCVLFDELVRRRAIDGEEFVFSHCPKWVSLYECFCFVFFCFVFVFFFLFF